MARQVEAIVSGSRRTRRSHEAALRLMKTEHPDPHRARARRLLSEHPEVRSLIGHDRGTALFVLPLLVVQVGCGFALAEAPWWAVLGAAYSVGAVTSLALWVLIHECAHDLVFRSSNANRWLALLANLPMILPAASSFRKYHLLHHRFHGDPALDGDLPSSYEVRLVGSSPWRKRSGWL
jgi:sphingolipid delta-4 desaturase